MLSPVTRTYIFKSLAPVRIRDPVLDAQGQPRFVLLLGT